MARFVKAQTQKSDFPNALNLRILGQVNLNPLLNDVAYYYYDALDDC